MNPQDHVVSIQRNVNIGSASEADSDCVIVSVLQNSDLESDDTDNQHPVACASDDLVPEHLL